jgi:hypothetical protein
MTDKCGHCPLATEDRPCPGQHNSRACTLADPESPEHRPGYADTLLRSRGPGLLEKAVNFAGAVATHVAAGMPAASEELKASRLAICRANTCGFYGEGDICRHASCGCSLDRKAAWAEQSCPIGLWGPITSPSAP